MGGVEVVGRMYGHRRRHSLAHKACVGQLQGGRVCGRDMMACRAGARVRPRGLRVTDAWGRSAAHESEGRSGAWVRVRHMGPRVAEVWQRGPRVAELWGAVSCGVWCNNFKTMYVCKEAGRRKWQGRYGAQECSTVSGQLCLDASRCTQGAYASGVERE